MATRRLRTERAQLQFHWRSAHGKISANGHFVRCSVRHRSFARSESTRNAPDYGTRANTENYLEEIFSYQQPLLHPFHHLCAPVVPILQSGTPPNLSPIPSPTSSLQYPRFLFRNRRTCSPASQHLLPRLPAFINIPPLAAPFSNHPLCQFSLNRPSSPRPQPSLTPLPTSTRPPPPPAVIPADRINRPANPPEPPSLPHQRYRPVRAP